MRSTWARTFLSNFWIPLALALIVWLGWHLEHTEWSIERPFHFTYNSFTERIVILVGIDIILAVSLQLINGISGQFSLGHAGFMAVGAYLAGYATQTFAAVETNDTTIDFGNPIGVVLFFVSLGVVVAIAGALLYLLFLLIRQSKRMHPSVPGILMVLVFAWFVADVSIAYQKTQTPVYLIWSKSVEWLSALFVWMTTHGAPYASAMSSKIPEIALRPLTLLCALIGGGAMAAIAGLIVGLPTLRLRGDYLAIATLGFAEIIRVIIVNSPPLGAATGMSVPTYSVEPDPDRGVIRFYYIFPWVFGAALLTTLIVARLKRSAKGRAIQAVREDEVAAAAVGIDPTHHKVIAFVIGAFFAGVGGALFAHFDGYLNANEFSFMKSVELVVIVTIGGLGSITGAIVAATALRVFSSLLLSASSWAPESMQKPAGIVEEHRLVIYALLLIIVMILRAKGWLRIPRWGSARRALA